MASREPHSLDYGFKQKADGLIPVINTDGKLYLIEATMTPDYKDRSLAHIEAGIGWLGGADEPGPGFHMGGGNDRKWVKFHPVDDPNLNREITGWLKENNREAVMRASNEPGKHFMDRGPDYFEGHNTPGKAGFIPMDQFKEMTTAVKKGEVIYAPLIIFAEEKRKPQKRTEVTVQHGDPRLKEQFAQWKDEPTDKRYDKKGSRILPEEANPTQYASAPSRGFSSPENPVAPVAEHHEMRPRATLTSFKSSTVSVSESSRDAAVGSGSLDVAKEEFRQAFKAYEGNPKDANAQLHYHDAVENLVKAGGVQRNGEGEDGKFDHGKFKKLVNSSLEGTGKSFDSARGAWDKIRGDALKELADGGSNISSKRRDELTKLLDTNFDKKFSDSELASAATRGLKDLGEAERNKILSQAKAALQGADSYQVAASDNKLKTPNVPNEKGKQLEV